MVEILTILFTIFGLAAVILFAYMLTGDKALVLVVSWLSIGVIAKTIDQYYPHLIWQGIFYVIVGFPILLVVFITIREYLQKSE